MVLKFGSKVTVSSCMNGSPTPRARNIAGMMTDMLHTMIVTATLTVAVKECIRGKEMCNMGEATRAIVPEIPSQTPGLTITRTACTSDASVVAIETEKMENKRKRNARLVTFLQI